MRLWSASAVVRLAARTEANVTSKEIGPKNREVRKALVIGKYRVVDLLLIIGTFLAAVAAFFIFLPKR